MSQPPCRRPLRSERRPSFRRRTFPRAPSHGCKTPQATRSACGSRSSDRWRSSGSGWVQSTEPVLVETLSDDSLEPDRVPSDCCLVKRVVHGDALAVPQVGSSSPEPGPKAEATLGSPLQSEVDTFKGLVETLDEARKLFPLLLKAFRIDDLAVLRSRGQARPLAFCRARSQLRSETDPTEKWSSTGWFHHLPRAASKADDEKDR